MADTEVAPQPPVDEAPAPVAPAPEPVVAAPAAATDQPAAVTIAVNGVPATGAGEESGVVGGDVASTSTTSIKYELREEGLDVGGDKVAAALRAGRLQDKDLEIDRDYTTRLISASGGFTSNVRENIMTHPVVVKNRMDATVGSTHISSESRQVMRKGFDLGISSPGLRMLYDARIKELEEELDAERAARNKSEKQRAELQRDLALLGDRADEAAEATKVQVEINRKRDVEFQKLHRELEEAQAQNEAQLVTFRKKHQEAVNQLSEQLDQLHKVKQKIEKEKNQQRAEIDELRGQIEHLTKAKLTSEKLNKQLEAQLSEAANKISEQQKEIADVTAGKTRVQQDRKSVV